MKINRYSLYSVLHNAQYFEIDREETNFLIEKAYQYSLSFLKIKYHNNIQFFSNNELPLEDIAMDAIVPLFINNENGVLGICRSLEKWDDSIENEADADYFLSRIVWRRVDQTVTKLLKDRDPIFDKILKTLNVCIQNNNFKKVRYFGTVLVLPKDSLELTGEIIEETAFNQIPEFYFSFKQFKLFNRIFSYILNETDFIQAIPLNLLVKRVKYYYSSKLLNANEISDHIDDFISFNDIMQDGLTDLKKKLDQHYVSRGKINRSESMCIFRAFENISKDMLNGGIHSSLYNYLKDETDDLSKDLFYTKYHHVMNYLLSRLKNRITSNISI